MSTNAPIEASQNEVLERLSNEFDLCAFGLNKDHTEWERPIAFSRSIEDD
jgi:hypothetical protein